MDKEKRYVDADLVLEKIQTEADTLMDIYCRHMGTLSDKMLARLDGVIHGLESARFRIKNVPAADVREVVHGHWERHNTYHGDDTSGFIDSDWRCSECGKQANVNEWFMYDLTDFCPHCGAVMDEAVSDGL